MNVQHDTSGRRWIQVEVETPGNAEEVWKAMDKRLPPVTLEKTS